MALSPSDKLGPYEIDELIGRGGMGAVYRAWDTRLGRPVAIKVLAGNFGSGAARFWREARAISSLNHPNICTIYDVGEHESEPYLVMELLEGATLKDRIGGKPLQPAQIAAWALQIASGLESAHQRGIVHRDLKPANIFITGGGVAKILDFGLATTARAAHDEAESTVTALTAPGSALGTVNYMSPEQARGGTADPRSDIFSFGAVLYEMATGRMAFPGSVAEAFNAILSGAPAPVGDPKLDAVIGKALRKDPAERYQSAAEMRRAFSHPAQNGASPVSRRKLMYAAGTAAAAVSVGVLVWRPAGADNSGRTVAVVLIENLTGDPSLDWMDRGLSELLTTAFAQSNALPVLSTERVRSAALHRFQGAANLKAEQARDVAAEARADLFVSGSLFKVGAGFRLNLRAQETDSGKLIYTGMVQGADPQGLFGMADRAAAAILAQIAPRSPAKIDSGGGLTTNVEALKAFTEGRILADQFLVAEANDCFRRATQLDSNFAMAYEWLSTGLALGDLPAARQAGARALAISARHPLPLTDRRIIESNVLINDERFEEAVKLLTSARKESPEEIGICLSLSWAHLELGQYGDAAAVLQEALNLDGKFVLALLTASYACALAGDLPKALQYCDRYAALLPANNVNAIHSRGDCLAINEHFDEALQEYRRGDQISGDSGPTPRLLAVMGRADEGEALLQAIPPERRQPGWWIRHSDLSMRRGNLDRALGDIEESIRHSPNPSDWLMGPPTWNAADILLEQRDPEGALAMTRRFGNTWAAGVRGVVGLIRGDETAAQKDFTLLRTGVAPLIGEFAAAVIESSWRIKAASYNGDWGSVVQLCAAISSGARRTYALELARAYLALGKLADAEAELRWLIRTLLAIGINPIHFQRFSVLKYMLARFHLAQVLERTGRDAEAVQWYRYFLSSFDHSTAKLPQIAEARAAIKRLVKA